MTRMKVRLQNEQLANKLDKGLVKEKEKKYSKPQVVAVDMPPGCETQMGYLQRKGEVKSKKETLLQDR